MTRPDSFDGNNYRKRVLAAIEARGGMQASDPFEWYDLPLEQASQLTDAVVAAQIEAVWAFWQKQRNHPKYRGLVTALLAVHRAASAELSSADSRRQLAADTRSERAERDHHQFAELDGAIERLVERFGGIPRSKLDGLRAFGTGSGMDAAGVERRLSRHRWVDDAPAPARPPASTISPAVYRQVRDNLDELGRILGTPPPVSLYDLLGVDPGASAPELARERDQAAAANRELRPDRRRALVDDLLAAITTLLLENDPVAYLDALASEVSERLRPRVAAAVLVEDEFTPDDYSHLLGEAQALGLDYDRALRVLAGLAGELGVAVPAGSGRGPGAPPRRPDRGPSPLPGAGRGAAHSPSPGGSGSAKAAHQALSRARAALRGGQVRQAQALVAEARSLAGGTLPPIRAISDEIDAVLAEAQQRWRAALAAVTARRFTEAAHTLERLLATAADVPGPNGQSARALLAHAQQGAAAADAALVAAQVKTGPARELALLAAIRDYPDHPGLAAALEAIGVQPPSNVCAIVKGRYVIVSWTRSSSPGTIDYRVEHVDGTGARRAFGTSQGTELEAALPASAGPSSRYAVVARRAGISSPEALSQTSSGASSTSSVPSPTRIPAPSAPSPLAARTPFRVPDAGAPPVITTLTLLSHGKRVRLVYPEPARGRAEVRRLPEGVVPPPPGTQVDPASCGELIPGMGPGLAITPRPETLTGYVVLTIDDVAVAGASAWYAVLAPVTGLHEKDGRIRWDWPAGCIEVVISWRPDAPPLHAGDPAAISRKLTNTRYELDGGLVLPVVHAQPTPGPLHFAVFTGTRRNGTLITGHEAARLLL